MKKVLLLSLFISLLLITKVYPQGGWFVSLNDSARYFTSVFFLNENTGWVVGDLARIKKTTNGGENWSSQVSGTIVKLFSIYFIDENTGWTVGQEGRIMKTTNGGVNRVNKQFLQSFTLKEVTFINHNTGWAIGNYYSGGGNKIQKTTNGGENWYSQSSGNSYLLGGVHFVNDSTGYIPGAKYISSPPTYIGLILKTTTGGETVGIGPIGNVIPEKYDLHQNYPNPFNPSTNIRFDLPKYSHVRLIVYDVLGREVAIFVNEKLRAGSYLVEWIASDYTSGVYYYRFVTQN